MIVSTRKSYSLAKDILDQDFISPEEIAVKFDFFYSGKDKRILLERLPPQNEFEWCRRNGMILVASPPCAFSLRTIQERYHCLNDAHPWYLRYTQEFSKNDTTEPLMWVALQKSPIMDSFGKKFTEQRTLVVESVTIPNIATTAWCLMVYLVVRGVRLYEKVRTRTSSIDSGGNSVSIGNFNASGIHIDHHFDNHSKPNLGISMFRIF